MFLTCCICSKVLFICNLFLHIFENKNINCILYFSNDTTFGNALLIRIDITSKWINKVIRAYIITNQQVVLYWQERSRMNTSQHIEKIIALCNKKIKLTGSMVQDDSSSFSLQKSMSQIILGGQGIFIQRVDFLWNCTSV